MNGKKRAFSSRWWLLVWCGFLAVGLAGGLAIEKVRAAPELPLCSQCISAISPADGSTVQTDATGNVTITASAQLSNTVTKFTFAIDQVDVDPTKIQVTGDPTAPTATVVTPLTDGKHHVFVQVLDASGPVASAGWDFTVVVTATPTPTVTPTATPKAGTSGGGDGSGGTGTSTTAKSGLVLNTVSLVFFSVAVVGLLVIAFIAGMWYGGRRLPTV